MGQCYENEQLGMDAAAIRCYRRALVNQDREGIALHKLVRCQALSLRRQCLQISKYLQDPMLSKVVPLCQALSCSCRPCCMRGGVNGVRQRTISE